MKDVYTCINAKPINLLRNGAVLSKMSNVNLQDIFLSTDQWYGKEGGGGETKTLTNVRYNIH